MSKKLVGEIIGVIEIGVGIITGNPVLIASGIATELGAILSPSAPKPGTTDTAVKAPIPPRVSAYGISRLYISYILYETDANGVAIDVGALHDGRMDGPDTFFLGDAAVASDRGIVGGTGDGAYSGGNVEIDYRLGLPTETAFSQVISHLPGAWDAQHRGDGVVTAMVIWQPVKSADYTKIYPNGQPALSLAARWQPVFDWRDTTQSLTDSTTWKWSENACLHLAHYLLVRDNKDWATHFAPTLAYWTAAANDCDAAMPVNGWQTYIVVPVKVGDTSIRVDSMSGLQAGMTLTVTADAGTAQTETFTVASVGAVSSTGVNIQLSSAAAYAHPNGSQVSWTGGNATEPRYRSCLAHKHTDAHKDVTGGLLGCFDGWLSPRSDGALMVFSGRYVAPTITIGPDEIVSYSIQDGVDEENAINSIALTYVSQNHQFNTVDCDPWVDEDDIEARGKVLSQQLANQVPSFTQARRLGKRYMARLMAPKRGTITTNAAGRIVRGQRFITVDLTEAGTTFYSGPVEVTKLTRNIATGGVTFDWILADPNVDAWEPETEEGNPAPIGSVVAPEPLAAPVITSATKNLQAVSGDGTGVRVSIVGTGPDRDDLIWFARWRVVGAAVWNEARYPDLTPGATVSIDTGFVPASATIETEIAYEQGDGRLSPYSVSFTVDTTAPSNGAAHQIVGSSVQYPLSSTDTTISIAAFNATMDYAYAGSAMVSLPAGTISGLTAGGTYAVFWNLATQQYLVSSVPALTALANPNYLFIGYQLTSSNGTYPSAGSTPPGGSAGNGRSPDSPQVQQQ